MPFINKVTPPKEMLISLHIDDFSGGLNNVMTPTILKRNESPELLNVLCHHIGALESRPGLFKYIIEQLPETIEKIFRYQTATFDYLICSSNTKIYKIDLNAESYSEICTVNGIISGTQNGDLFYFVDGVKYRVYNGTNVYEIIEPLIETYKIVSGTTTTIVLPSTANATDDYYNGWEVFISSGLGYGEKANVTDYVGSTKTLSIDFTTTPDGTSVIYMTNKPQGVVTTDEVGKTKVYVPSSAEYTDAFKGGNNISMVNNCKLMALHKNRFWFTLHDTNLNVVFSTDLDNMYYIPVNAFYPPLTNDGDSVNGLKSFNDVLIITKAHSIFALYGMDKDDFVLKKVSVATGVYNNDVMQQIGNYLYYFGTDGHIYKMYDVRTDVMKMSSKNISGITIDIKKQPIGIDLDIVERVHSLYSNDFYMLVLDDKILAFHSIVENFTLWNNISPTAMFDLDGKTLITNENKYIYVMPFSRFYITENFTASDEGDNTFQVAKGYLNETTIDIVVKRNGVVIEHNYYEKLSLTDLLIHDCEVDDEIEITYLTLPCYSDDGAEYKQVYHTKDMDFGYSYKTKKIRTLHVQAQTFKFFKSVIKFKAWIDYQEYQSGIELINQITLWGISVFGDRFINKNIVDSLPMTINSRGKVFRFIFESDIAEQPFIIYRINGEINIRN